MDDSAGVCMTDAACGADDGPCVGTEDGPDLDGVGDFWIEGGKKSTGDGNGNGCVDGPSTASDCDDSVEVKCLCRPVGVG